MKTTQFKLQESSYNFSCNVYPAKSQYKFTMSLGRVFPTTSTQARYFLQQGICLDVLNSRDVEVVESLLNKHGFEGQYTFTKSGRWVRLVNNEALNNALKAEYSI